MRRRVATLAEPLSVAAASDTTGASQKEQEPAVLSPLSPISPWPPEPQLELPAVRATAGQTIQPEASSTLPTAKEVYGSLAVLLTYISGVVYLVWAFAPIGWLDQWGWTWYPDREWSVIVPCYMMLLVLFTYWIYTAMVAFNTPAFDSPSLITDPFARIPVKTANSDPYYWRFAEADAIPEAVDLPIDLVNRVLYPARPRPK